MTRKPRILLIPDVAWWTLGEIGKQIIARFSDKYDFYFLPETLFQRRPELLHALVPAVDAIHCLNESSIGLLRVFKQSALPPLATWIHHLTRWSPDHQMALEWSSSLTVCTRAWKQFLEARMARSIPVTVVPHGVDTEFFRKATAQPRRFGIPANRFVIGFVGSKSSDLEESRKDIDTFLKVVRRTAEHIPNLHVVLGGPGWAREMVLLQNEHISVSTTGFLRRADLPALYSALDIFLLTSRVEGGPCTVLEAMACETVVVSTRVGEVPACIVDGVNGFSAEVDDSDALLFAVVQLEKNPWKRQQVAKNARKSMLARSWQSALTPLGGVYDELIRQRHSASHPAPEPAWMHSPDKLLRASCAADALAHVVPRIRNHALHATQGVAQVLGMLNGQSVLDLPRGAALLTGATFRTGRAQPFHGWTPTKPPQSAALGDQNNARGSADLVAPPRNR